MNRLTFTAALVAIVAGLALTGLASAAAHSNTLIATDGPGFTITMNKKTVKAGTYTIVVHDKSNIHNFHLVGRGVNKLTSIPRVYTTRWTVKLRKGTYKFRCDPHAAIMKGTLKVT
jgi:plastocyanin